MKISYIVLPGRKNVNVKSEGSGRLIFTDGVDIIGENMVINEGIL